MTMFGNTVIQAAYIGCIQMWFTSLPVMSKKNRTGPGRIKGNLIKRGICHLNFV
jgi:hypothetical protein